MTAPITMELNEVRLRIAPWRTHSSMALITPLCYEQNLDGEIIKRALEAAAARGFTGAYSSALGPSEGAAFQAAGFAVDRKLHLLILDVVRWQRKEHRRTDQSRLSRLLPQLRQTRIARASEYDQLLDVDQAAFDSFWGFDRNALQEAISATPNCRVAANATKEVVGYHITGRARDQGYIQRLAVRPDQQGSGIGRTLLVDSLAWLQRNRVRTAHVNTQIDNVRALTLYESEGFVNQPDPLSVFVIHFDARVRVNQATGRKA